MTAFLLLILILPIQQKYIQNDTPKNRIDERDIMFSRRLLQKGSKQFTDYYQRNPKKKELDEKFRTKPVSIR
jgi:hypothetical protein